MSLSIRRLTLILCWVDLIAIPVSALGNTLNPASVYLSLSPGECRTVRNEVRLQASQYTRADILISVDISDTMGEEISALKEAISTMVQDLGLLIRDPAFGLMTVQDYDDNTPNAECNGGIARYGGLGDIPARIAQPIDANIGSILSAVNDLPQNPGGGGDFPESYSLAFFKAYADPGIGWRPGARRLLVSFGDDLPHDCNLGACEGSEIVSTGPDPGGNGVPGDADDLQIMAVMDSLRTNAITLIHINSSPTFTSRGRRIQTLWSCLAPRAAAGGSSIPFVPSGGSALTQLVRQAISTIGTRCDELTIRVGASHAEWVRVSPARMTDIDLPSTRFFSEVICPPIGTPPGRYLIPLAVMCDGEERITREDTVEVVERVYPRNGYLGIYGDQAGTQCQIPVGSAATLYLVATLGGASAATINGAAFRIEVTHPENYTFTYTPPSGAVVAGESPVDETPGDPNDERGVLVTLAACPGQAIPRPDGRFDFGTIHVLNNGGATSDLLLKRVTPGSSDVPDCPAFLVCGSTPGWVCMTLSEDALGSDPIAFHSVINGSQGPSCGVMNVRSRSWSAVKSLYR